MRLERITFSNVMVVAVHEPNVLCVGFALSRWCHTLRQIFVWVAKTALRSWPILE